MKRIPALIAYLALICCQPMQAQKFETVVLADWIATDALATAVKGGQGVSLSAGGQLSRVYPADRVAVRMTTRPVFSNKPTEWATLELGPVSLTFVRDSNGGEMVLLGDEPLALPFALPLDEQGRSIKALDLMLAYDRSESLATLSLHETAFEIRASTATKDIEIVLSTGRAASWSIEKLEVARFEEELTSTSGGQASEETSSVTKVPTTAELVATRKAATRDAKILFAENKDLAAEKALTDGNHNPKNTTEWHLESANQLVQLAFSMTRRGKPEKAVQLARRALEHTEKAARKAARDSTQLSLSAEADALSAYVHERLLADPNSAKSFYESAKRRQPSNQAAIDLLRLNKAENEAKRKSGSHADEMAVPEPSGPPAPLHPGMETYGSPDAEKGGVAQ